MAGDQEIQEWLERGHRLALIRGLLSMNRAQLSRALGVSTTTISYWETLSHGGPGINPRHAPRIIQMASALGVEVTSTWLLKGEGKTPYRRDFALPQPLNQFHFDFSEKKIASDVDALVKKWGSNYVAYKMSNDTMFPLIYPGDFIIARVVDKEEWLGTFHHPSVLALVTLNDGRQLLRFFSLSEPGKFCVHCANIRPIVVEDTHFCDDISHIKSVARIAVHFQHGSPNVDLSTLSE